MPCHSTLIIHYRFTLRNLRYHFMSPLLGIHESFTKSCYAALSEAEVMSMMASSSGKCGSAAYAIRE